jgi:hypothetical protein
VDAPDGRYKIVERNRRLVTIDTFTGREIGTGGSVVPPPTSTQTMAARPAAEAKQSTLTLPSEELKNPWQSANTATSSMSYSSETKSVKPTNSSASFQIRTNAAYDNKGPRTVRISIFELIWWAIVHHWRVVIFFVFGAILFSWLFFLFPLLFFATTRRALLMPFRSSLTKFFDDCDQVAEG